MLATRPLVADLAHHPVVITRQAGRGLEDILRLVHTHRRDLDELLRCHGGVLIRGFETFDAAGLARCAEALGGSPFSYRGGDSPRSAVGADVYTSTEFPASEVISLHHEMSYLPRWPRRLFFQCVVPAAKGGQTSLANTRDVTQALPEPLRRRFVQRRLRYIRNFPPIPLGKSWQDTYGTQDRQQLERIVAEQDSNCAWLEDGTLRVSTCCPAFVPASDDGGQPLWFNQAEQWHPSSLGRANRRLLEGMLGRGNLPHECSFENGEELTEADLAEVRQALQSHKLLFDWEAGDLLMIDNLAMLHGREAFEGPRRVLVYLSGT